MVHCVQFIVNRLYEKLDTKEGEKDLYRLARQRDRAGKDVLQVRVIKDADGNVLTSEESVLRRWMGLNTWDQLSKVTESVVEK